MMKALAAKTVDEYIKSFPAKQQILLRQLRRAIKATAPLAEELISYGIAAYKYQGIVIYFAGFNNHVSVYPAPRTAPAFKNELSAYKGGKGTVQFPLDKPLPLGLVKRMVQYRIKANKEKVALKKKVSSPAKRVKKKKVSAEDPVRTWLRNLEPLVRQDINAVRKIIKTGSPQLQERIKWNAPSYYYKEDIVTFGPYKKDKILLVFHHPAVVRVPSALLQGDYKDRRLVYFKNKAEAAKHKKEISRIIREITRSIDRA